MVIPLYIAKYVFFPPYALPSPWEIFFKQSAFTISSLLDNLTYLRASAAQLVDPHLLPLNSESGICICFQIHSFLFQSLSVLKV